MADGKPAAVSGAAAVKPVATGAPADAGGENDNEAVSMSDILGEMPDVSSVLGTSTTKSESPPANPESKEEETETAEEKKAREEKEAEAAAEAARGKEGTETEEEKKAREEKEAKDAEEAAKKEAEDKAAAEAAQEEEEAQGWPESAHKRVGKLTAQKKEAQEKLASTEKALSETQAALEKANAALDGKTPSAAVVQDDPLANVDTPEDLQKRVQNAQRIKKWALENLQGATIKDKDGNETDLSAEDVKKHLTDADEILSTHAPRRAAFIELRKTADQEAREAYPLLFDKTTQDHQAAQASLRAYPWLRSLPNAYLILGDAIEGMKLRQAKVKKAKTTSSATKVPPPKAPPTPTRSSPPKVDASKRRVADKEQKFIESNGDRKALEELVESIV